MHISICTFTCVYIETIHDIILKRERVPTIWDATLKKCQDKVNHSQADQGID